MAFELGHARAKITLDTSGIVAAEGKVKQASAAMTGSLGAIGISLGLLGAVQIGRSAFGLAQAAAQAEVTEQSFRGLAAGINESADGMLDGMKRAARGTISEANLILGANRAIASGVADSSAEVNQLLTIAGATARTYGISTTEAYNRIVLGLSKLEPELLDELGIKANLNKVNTEYAASIGKTADALSESEKRQALFNAVVAQTQPLVDAAAGSTDTAAENFGQFEAKVADAWQGLGDFLLAAGATDSLETFITALENSQKQLQEFQLWIENVRKRYAEFYAELSQSIPFGPIVAYFDRVREAAESYAEVLAEIGRLLGWNQGIAQPTLLPSAANSSPAATGNVAPIFAASGDSGIDSGPSKLDILKQDRFDDLVELERDSLEQRANAIEQFGDRVSSAERSYQKSMAREAEDFGRQRLRAEQEFAESILDIRADAARREARQAADLARMIGDARADSAERVADFGEDHDKRIAEAREDANDRLIELEEDYQKNRERAAEAHGDRLADAAGRLDAKAVYEEQRNFARQEKDAKEAHDEQISDLQEALQERIDQENESYAERLADEAEALDKRIRQANEAAARQLADAQAADAERIADMTADFEERKILEDEDRAIRLTRMAIDHQDQMAEMGRQHALNLAQIAEQEAAERAKLEEEFQKELNELGIRTQAYQEKMRQYETMAKASFDSWWEHVNSALASAAIGPAPLSPMIGAPGTYPSMGGGSRTVTVASGGIVINEASRPGATKDEVVRALTEIMEGQN